MSKLSLHLQSVPAWVPQFIERSGVQWIKWIDPPEQNPGWNVKVIGRTFEPDSESNARIWQGAAGARSWFQKWEPFYLARTWVHCWEAPNEPQPMADPNFRACLNEFTVELARLMHGAGLRLVGMNWSVGWPDIGHAPEMGPGVQACDYLGLHEYSAPAMWDTVGYHCLRYRKTSAELTAAGYNVPPILVTECGIDGGVVQQPGKAWRTFCEGDFDRYLEQLAWYSGELDKDNVAAATIFTVCNWDWFDFSITEAEAMPLADWISQNEPPPPPERARGIDVSQWQADIDWQAVADSEVEFCFIRSSVGDRIDSCWETNYQGARAAGLLVGAYHYIEPFTGNQAGTFARAVAGKTLALGCWADIEHDDLTADKCANFFKYAEPQIDHEIGIYSSAYKFDRYGTPAWAKGRLLWVADWLGNLEPILPDAWDEWEFWQTTSDGAVPGIEGRVDLDVYAGTSAELQDKYGNGGEPVGDVRVFDKDGNERDWQWAVDRYGVRLVEADPPEGATVYRLTELRQKVGPCGLVVHVQDEDGNPLEGIAVLQGWVDGDDLPADAAPRLSEDVWAQPDGKPNKGGGGRTNASGDFGWGWGPGEQYDPATQEGAHWYWVMPGDLQWYSDVALGFGWLFGSDHDHLDITMTRTAGSEEPPPPPPDDDLVAQVARVGDILERIERDGLLIRTS